MVTPLEKQVLIGALATAIAEYEGFFITKKQATVRKLAYPTLAQRNNNPGNLRPWPGCTLPVVGGYIKFSEQEAGWRQLEKQIEKNVFTRRLTFAEFFGGKPGVYAGYAPGSDGNHPRKYAKFVADKLSAAPGDIIANLLK